MTILNPDRWVALYADYLLQYANFRLNDIQICEDLVQETFLSALKAKASFKGESSEKTWLTSILRNKIIDEYRKKKPNLVENLMTDDADFFDQFFELTDKGLSHWKPEHMPQSWDNSVEDRLMGEEFQEVLMRCIGKLSPNQAALIQEKYIELSPSEKICKDFNLSKSNYWVTMHRIHLQLRKCLELNWFLS